MAVNAIDNSNLKDYKGTEGTADFTPGVSYVYDATNAEVDVTDGSTFPSGVSLLRAHIYIHDKFGGQVNGTIENPDGSDSAADRTSTIDVSELNRSKPLDIKATVVGDDGMLIADGIATDIGAAGEVGSWDKQKNASA